MGSGPEGVSIVAQMSDQIVMLETTLRKLKEFAAANPEATITQGFDYIAVSGIFDQVTKGSK